MLTPSRIRELRVAANLRQEDIAVLLSVGIATVSRWERPEGTLPTGFSRQILEALDTLAKARVDLSTISVLLRQAGSLAAIRWILNSATEGGHTGA